MDLCVHQPIGGGPLPTYVRRPHDELLRAVLDPAVPPAGSCWSAAGPPPARPTPPAADILSAGISRLTQTASAG
jgi:hypothetical protein